MTRALALFLLILLLPAGARAQLGVPEVGEVQKWVCDASGEMPQSYVTKVLGLQDGLLMLEEQIDNEIGHMQQPAGVRGLHLYTRRELPDGKVLTQEFDPADFAPYTALTPGAEFNADVEESDGDDSWTWRYSIEIGQPKRVRHELLGEVDAIVVKEERWVYRESRGTSHAFLIVPGRALPLSWSYSSDEGNQDCDLYLSFKKKPKQQAQ